MSGEDAVYELTIDQPNLPKGEPIQIPGLGTFENGHSYTVTKDQANAFRVYHTRQVSVTDEAGAIVGSRPERGQTLLQAADTMYGVTVETVEAGTRAQNTNRSTTVTDADTSTRTPSDSLSDADTPKSDTGGTDSQPESKTKAKNKGGDN